MSSPGDAAPEIALPAPEEWMSWTESEKAWMSIRDADLLEVLFLAQARRVGRAINVLEWGGGRSTLWYSALLQKRGLLGSWLTIEHNREFFMEKLAPEFDRHPERRYRLVDAPLEPPLRQLEREAGSLLAAAVFDAGDLRPIEPDRLADRAADLDDYVRLPSLLGRRFDLVIVDGRKRRRCLLEAAEMLSEQGMTVLHDAWRSHYECALPAYASGTHIGDELWVGTQHPMELREMLPAHAFEEDEDE
jgi:hypothetical protein